MEKYAAVIVTFNPDKDIYDNIKKISEQVDRVFIVDNGSSETEFKRVECLEKISNVELVTLEKNFGLAHAQNIALKKGIVSGFNWFLMLDDDSEVSNTYINDIKRHISDDALIYVPSVLDLNSANYSKVITGGMLTLHRKKHVTSTNNVLVAISSGMLINRKVFDEIGYMNSNMFIDYVDIDFCLRAKKFTKIRHCSNVILAHRLGSKKVLRWKFISITVSKHSAFRRYYIFRNRIYIWKKYFTRYPVYIIYEMNVSIVEFFKIVLFENNKRDNLLNIINGICDGLKGMLK